MRRVGAAPSYFFSREYFDRFGELLGERCQLFVCKLNGSPICAGIFVKTGAVVQYHLGGTATSALKLAPMKLLIDEVRRWGASQGCTEFSLGGAATGNPQDTLLNFKLGFSDRTRDYKVWQWVLAPEIYESLCNRKERWNLAHRLHAANANFFPYYRCPTVANAAMTASTPLQTDSTLLTASGAS